MTEDDAPWSTLGFAEEAAVVKGPTQNARVLSEGWVAANAFCPGCGATPLTAFAANSPVADFHCGVCAEEYELKATKGRTDGLGPSPVGRGLEARRAQRAVSRKGEGRVSQSA